MHECKTVTLRTRPLKKNMLSFYLDYYPGYRDKESMKVIRHESLGIYIYAEPKNQREQNFNAVMSEKAEAIRCRRFESIVNERYDFFDKSKMKGDFLAYYKKTLRKHDQKWEFVYLHFFNFVGGKCSFEEIDVDLCNKFREYLLNAKQLRRPERPISRNSAVGYWSTFRGFLKILYRNKLIHSNVNDFLDKIEPEDVVKDYLSVDELYRLAETPCKIPVLKTASLFSCLTSLRISDEALQLIGYSPEKTGLVFKGLKRCWTQYPMKEWIRAAGITKNITFHQRRHTFATLALTAGVDIYTTSQLLGHANIRHTQRYAQIINSKKDHAISLLDDAFIQ